MGTEFYPPMRMLIFVGSRKALNTSPLWEPKIMVGENPEDKQE